MLNRHNAELELKESIQKLLPDWTDEAQIIEPASVYIDELLRILPDYSAAPAPNSKPDAAQKIALLRRRLINILAKEQELNLEKSLCDTVFNIQITLAKLFPFNKEVSEENEQPLAVEAWEETFTFEVITRETEDLIIYPESAVLTRASTQEYYQGQFGKDEAGNPRNFDNTLMSDRQILSLQRQGINIQIPALVEDNLEPEFDEFDEYDFEAGADGDESFGKSVGAKLGKVITYTAAFAIMTICRGPVLFSASVLMGAVTTCAAGPKGFHQGFLATFLLGAAAQALFVVTTAACYVGGVLAEDTARLAVDFLSASTLPLVLPAIVFIAAVNKAIHHNQNISATFTKMTTNIFFTIPIKYSAQLGEFIDNGITAVYQFIKNKLLGNASPMASVNSINSANNVLPASPSSHAVIMLTMAINPLQVEDNAHAENQVAPSFPNPILISVPVPIQNERNDADHPARSGLAITI